MTFGQLFWSLVLLFLVLCLTFLDYWLTLKGADAYQKWIAKHYEREQFELNPLFQKAIRERRYHPRHAITVLLLAIFSFGFIWLTYRHLYGFSLAGLQVYAGVLLGMYVPIIVRHFQNLATARVLRDHGDEIQGKLTEKYTLTLRTARIHMTGIAWITLVLFAANPTYFGFGFTFGNFLLVSVASRWLRRALKSTQTSPK